MPATRPSELEAKLAQMNLALAGRRLRAMREELIERRGELSQPEIDRLRATTDAILSVDRATTLVEALS